MVLVKVSNAAVRDAVTGELNSALIGQQVQVVVQDTTTPFPIQDGAGDPIPDSLLTVQTSHCVPTFWIDTAVPADLYLDWYQASSGARNELDFAAVLRDEARAARIAAETALADLQAYILANPGISITDHGALSGLADDDHVQYHNDTRGDLRYYPREEAAGLIATAVAAAAPANRDRANHTGLQAISSVENLESRLQEAASSGGSGSGVTLLEEGTEPPLGSPPGLYAFIPSGPPLPTVETISYDSEGTTVTCAVPAGAAIGDAVVFIPGFDPATTAGTISSADAGWTEIIDYSGNHTRDTAVYVYRITDSTALAALGANVTATYTESARRMGVCFTIPGSLVASAWPAYTSGSNRSAATINSNTTTGCQIQGFATATVAFHKVCLFTMHDTASDPAASSGFTLVGFATGSAGGSAPRTLTVLIKDLAAAPIPAATVTHATASSSTHGGGQFIVPDA